MREGRPRGDRGRRGGRLVELHFGPGEPSGLQMFMALLPPGGKLVAYGNGMDALSAVADWWPMVMAWQQTDRQEDWLFGSLWQWHGCAECSWRLVARYGDFSRAY